MQRCHNGSVAPSITAVSVRACRRLACKKLRAHHERPPVWRERGHVDAVEGDRRRRRSSSSSCGSACPAIVGGSRRGQPRMCLPRAGYVTVQSW